MKYTRVSFPNVSGAPADVLFQAPQIVPEFGGVLQTDRLNRYSTAIAAQRDNYKRFRQARSGPVEYITMAPRGIALHGIRGRELGALDAETKSQAEALLHQLDSDEQALAQEIDQVVASGAPVDQLEAQHKQIVDDLVALNAQVDTMEQGDAPTFFDRASTLRLNIVNLTRELANNRVKGAEMTEVRGVLIGTSAVLGAGVILYGLYRLHGHYSKRSRRHAHA